MSVLRNGHLPCHYFCNIHVNFKMIPYPMSNLRNALCRVTYFFPHVARLHVDFKKLPCCWLFLNIFLGLTPPPRPQIPQWKGVPPTTKSLAGSGYLSHLPPPPTHSRRDSVLPTRVKARSHIPTRLSLLVLSKLVGYVPYYDPTVRQDKGLWNGLITCLLTQCSKLRFEIMPSPEKTMHPALKSCAY